MKFLYSLKFSLSMLAHLKNGQLFLIKELYKLLIKLIRRKELKKPMGKIWLMLLELLPN